MTHLVTLRTEKLRSVTVVEKKDTSKEHVPTTAVTEEDTLPAVPIRKEEEEDTEIPDPVPKVTVAGKY